MTSSPAQEVTATTMAKLIRKKDHEAFLGVVNEGHLVYSGKPCEKTVTAETKISELQKQVLQKFFEEHGSKVDQFVDNVVNCQVSNEDTKLTAIRNRLYISSNQGREPFERMYQRTTFQYKWG